MIWDAQLYERFTAERLQPVLDLISRLPRRDFARILDIGCGSGLSTIALFEAFPNAQVIGVDNSPEMLSRAREVAPQIHWIERDCALPLEDLGKFDLVFSNAFLQWLPDQPAFLHQIPSLLTADGIFALQVPDHNGMLSSACISRVAQHFPQRFDSLGEHIYPNLTLARYYDELSSDFSDIEIWETDYHHVMQDHAQIIEFIRSTSVRPYLELLDSEEQQRFCVLLERELFNAYPMAANGKVLFHFKRIEWIAQKFKGNK